MRRRAGDVFSVSSYTSASRWHSTTSHANYKSYVVLSLLGSFHFGHSQCKIANDDSFCAPISPVYSHTHNILLAGFTNWGNTTHHARLGRKMPVSFHNRNFSISFFFFFPSNIRFVRSLLFALSHLNSTRISQSTFSLNQIQSHKQQMIDVKPNAQRTNEKKRESKINKEYQKWRCLDVMKENFFLVFSFPSLLRSAIRSLFLSISIQLFWRHTQTKCQL